MNQPPRRSTPRSAASRTGPPPVVQPPLPTPVESPTSSAQPPMPPPIVGPPPIAEPVSSDPVDSKREDSKHSASKQAESKQPPSKQSASTPEQQLPRVLYAMVAGHGRTIWKAIRGPQYQLLTNFTRDLGVCVRSSTEISSGLELCIRAIRKTRLGICWRAAPRMIRQGASLTAALKPGEPYLPPFFIPVIKAGEESGRIDDALDFLQHHCKLLASPANSLRNLWLIPVIVMLFGSAIKVLILLLMGSLAGAVATLLVELIGWLQLIVILAIVLLPPVRFFIDGIRLHAPLLGDFERDVAFHRFFRVMALLYSVSGQRVEKMVRTAAQSTTNRAARIELLKAAKAIENKATISEAFKHVSILSDDQKSTIEVGDIAGSLEEAFNNISDQTGANMIAKIGYVRPFLMRAVMFSTVMAIMGTILSVVLSAR